MTRDWVKWPRPDMAFGLECAVFISLVYGDRKSPHKSRTSVQFFVVLLCSATRLWFRSIILTADRPNEPIVLIAIRRKYTQRLLREQYLILWVSQLLRRLRLRWRQCTTDGLRRICVRTSIYYSGVPGERQAVHKARAVARFLLVGGPAGAI